MPKAYWITAYREIKDAAKLAAYAKLAPTALAPYGVRYLCRGNPNATFEAGLKERLVVSEFPSLEKAIDGHDSPATRRRYARSATAPCAISESLKAWSEAQRAVMTGPVPSDVMAELVPAIHVLLSLLSCTFPKTWMPGHRAGHDEQGWAA